MSYTIIKEIGRGGMGCVYKGQDANGKIVAIKMMSNRVTCFPEYRQLFQSEVDTLKRMDHPSVVHIVGDPYCDEAGNLYLPMEFVDGETIEQHVSTKGTFVLDEAVALMSKILEALQYVHDRQRIHRDIKPSNIMLRPNGSVCVIDFGIAKDARIGGSGQTVGRVIGTDGYMSPEQARGLHIDHRTDIYSLGCVFFYLLTGQHAVQKGNNDYTTVVNILNGNMPLPSQTVSTIPSTIDDVFLKAVDKNMVHRYQTAVEFKEALEEACGQAIPKITVGSRSDNDIQINNEYVSKHHLIIKGLEQPLTGGAKKFSIELTDNSTNGTGVNGRPLKKSSMVIDYNGTVNLPEVLLAARAECPLNWNEVVSKLKTRGWNPVSSPPPPPPPPQEESLNVFLGIVSFFIPLVGWILWGVWHKEHPRKAFIAARLAWAGFALNIITLIILQS